MLDNWISKGCALHNIPTVLCGVMCLLLVRLLDEDDLDMCL